MKYQNLFILAPCFGARHVFTLLAFLGFINIYAMRVNLSVAIVAMVKSKPSGGNGTNFEVNNTCPVPIKPNSTDENFYTQVKFPAKSYCSTSQEFDSDFLINLGWRFWLGYTNSRVYLGILLLWVCHYSASWRTPGWTLWWEVDFWHWNLGHIHFHPSYSHSSKTKCLCIDCC